MAHLVRLLVVLVLAACAYAEDPSDSSCPKSTFTALQPFNTTYPVLDLEWVGKDDQTVYAITSGGTSKGTLWRSKDGGGSFNDLTEKLTGNSARNLTIIGIHVMKSNANNIVILGGGTNYWISNNMGETITKMSYPGGVRGVYIRDVRFNPRQETWVIMHVKRASCKVIDRAHLECPKDLMLNKNAFDPNSEWINMTTNSNGALAGFVDFDWGANLCPLKGCPDLPDIPDSLIMATAYARAEDYDKPWDKDVGYLVSTDFFATSTLKLRCGNQLEIVGRSVYLAVANSCPDSPDGSPLPVARTASDAITLFTSMDGGNSFARACLPLALQQDGYELVETHDGRGALVIADFAVDVDMMMPLYAASVYAAGPHHALFSLSLTNVFQGIGSTETTDFTRLEGLSGIYFANQIVQAPSSDGSAGSTDPASGRTPMDMDTSAYSDYYGEYYDIGDLVGPPLIETRVTYSAGGRWQRIRAPTTTRNSECACPRENVPEGTPCFLHLNGMSAIDRMHVPLPGIYSSPSAPGLVMATGNLSPLGLGLDQSAGVCTWLSQDGGMNWIDVAVGPYIYEFADWGGVVVMAKYPGMERYMKSGLTDKVLFSTDYGGCWQEVSLSTPLYVDNIRIEPDGQQPIVIVHGETPRNASGSNLADVMGVMYKVDLQNLLGWSKCSTENKDFEMWSPPTVSAMTRCVLGQQLQLERRKASSKCFYGSAYQRPAPVNSTTCNCTKQLDTECDYGFIRFNDSCKAIDSKSMPKCPVVERGLYTVSSSGLRKVHGDQCLGIERIIGDTNGQGKPTSTGGDRRTATSNSGWVTAVVIVVVLAVVIGGGFAWWRFRATDDQQETVREMAANAAGAVASAWGLLVDKIRSIRFRSAGSHPHAGTGEEMGYFQPLGDPGYDVEGRGNIFTLK